MSSSRRLLASLLVLALFGASVPSAAWAAVEQARGPEAGAPVAGIAAGPAVVALPQPLAPSAVVEAPGVSIGGAAAAAAAGAEAVPQAQAAAQALPAMSALRSAAPQPGAAGRPSRSGDAGSVVFDGSASKRGFLGGLVGASVDRLKASPLGRFLPKRSSAPSDLDFHHGPKYTPLTLRQQAAAGLRWGIYLTGLSELARQALAAAGALLPWQANFSQLGPKIAELPLIGSWLPQFAAGAESRMELLADWGPKQIAHALSAQPWSFVLYELPKAVAWETLYYQAFLFGGLAVALRALKPAAEALARRLDGADDAALFGLKRPLSALPRLMLAASAWAFPIAAVMSATAFGAAHLGAWGLSASAFLIPSVSGAALAYLSYKTRSFVPAFLAHLTYNALLVGGILLAAVSAQTAGLFSTLVPLGAVAFLAYAYYRHLRAQAPGWSWLKTAAGHAGAVGGTLAAGVLAAALLAGPMPQAPGVLQTEAAVPTAKLELAKPADQDLTVEQIVALNKPAVANIVVHVPNGMETGSGSIIDPKGLIVTNNHVIDAVGVGGRVLIRLNDGETVPGRVLAANKQVDLAFVQIEADPPEGGWPVIALGDSDELKEGQKVVAMGYPFGFPFTVTSGIVSGLGEGQRRPYAIQHDGAVNPGNSGGPLFDMKGRQIGVNTAIFSKTGNFAGVSYARSSAQVFAALEQYQKTGTISPAWLGIVVDKADPLLPDQGVTLDAVRPGSPAEKAGLRAGDLIVSLNGQPLPPGAGASVMTLNGLIESKAPGEKVTLGVLRGDQTLAVPVTLGELLSHPRPTHARKGTAPMPQPKADIEGAR